MIKRWQANHLAKFLGFSIGGPIDCSALFFGWNMPFFEALQVQILNCLDSISLLIRHLVCWTNASCIPRKIPIWKRLSVYPCISFCIYLSKMLRTWITNWFGGKRTGPFIVQYSGHIKLGQLASIYEKKGNWITASKLWKFYRLPIGVSGIDTVAGLYILEQELNNPFFIRKY